MDGAALTPNQQLARKPPIGLVILLGALSAFGPFSLDTYLPALPRLREDFGATASLAALTVSACLLGLALGQLLAGPVSDRYGRRRPLMVGLAFFAIASLLCALSPSIWALIALRVLQGVGGAAGIVISRAIVRDLYGGIDAARFFSKLMIVNGLAPIVAPLVGGQLLKVMSWRGIFVVLAGLGLVLLVAAMLTLPETLEPERRVSGGLSATLSTFGMLLRDRTFMGYALAVGFGAAALFSYIAGSPFVLQEMFGISEQQFSLIFATNSLGIVIAGQVNGRLVGRIPLRRMLAFGLVGCATGGLLLLTVVLVGSIGLVGILPALFLTIASLGFVFPNASALALADHPRTAGAASALLGVMQYAIGTVVAPLTGLGGKESALPLALCVATSSAMAVVAFIVMTRNPAPAPVPE